MAKPTKQLRKPQQERNERTVSTRAYSILLFGEDAGPNLLNLLLSGREGMKKYREEAEKLGIVVLPVVAQPSHRRHPDGLRNVEFRRHRHVHGRRPRGLPDV